MFLLGDLIGLTETAKQKPKAKKPEKLHDDEAENCDCYECLDKDYWNPNGSWFDKKDE